MSERLREIAAWLAALDDEDPADGERYSALIAEAMRFPADTIWRLGRELCASSDMHERIVGADLLGGVNGIRVDGAEAARRLPVLRDLLDDPFEDVIAAAIAAIANLDLPESFAIVAPLARHPDEDIRFQVMLATTFRPEPLAISVLIEGTLDESTQVRDWATFQLAGLEVDSPGVRDALRKRLEDEGITVRIEAICGLVERGEGGLSDRVLDELASEDFEDATPSTLWRAVTTLAGAQPDRRFRRHLRVMLDDYGANHVDCEFEDAVLLNFQRGEPERECVLDRRRRRHAGAAE